MVLTQHKLTVAEFEQIVNLPENNDKILELIDGEVVEKMPTNPYSSAVAIRIAYFISQFAEASRLGYVTGADGGYIIDAPHYFVPDVAFISKAHQPELPRSGYNPIPPDLAVEVISPTDRYSEVARKVAIYLKRGTQRVWVVDCDNRTLTVHNADGAKTYSSADVVDGGDLLPGFTLVVDDLFPA